MSAGNQRIDSRSFRTASWNANCSGPGTIHRDRYDDSDLEAQIDGYDTRRRALFAIPDEKQRMTDRYGLVENYGRCPVPELPCTMPSMGKGASVRTGSTKRLLRSVM